MRLRLWFRTGHHQGQTLDFVAPRTLVLGRSSVCDVQVYDERISRRHCAIRVDERDVRLKDLGSGNGTFVNGVEIREASLADGDVVMIGRTEIQAWLQAEGPAIPPTSSAGPPTGRLAAPPGLAGSAMGLQATAPVRPVPCAICEAPIPPAELPLAAKHRGKVLCSRCAPRIEVPGFRLERSLGEGAMGVVYLATDLSRNQPVALKVLKAQAEVSAEDRARFAREVQTSASLEHPNIVRVLTWGVAPPFLYYVMEFVPGRSLKGWIEAHGPLPLPSALRISIQVGEALEHARERHIVHRDVKPENIMVQADGRAKLADFGLAKNLMTSGASGLTRPGDGLGTLPYMPPEQVQDALNADHRSDLYSYGATIYHMLTGRPPFVARTPLEYFRLIHEGTPPPIGQFRQDVPRVLVSMIERSMAKRPEERFQTVGEMLTIMRQFVHDAFDTKQTNG